MSGRGDPRRPVDIQARVIAVVPFRLARVHPHPHAHVAPFWPATRRKRSLSGHRGGDGVARTREHHEEAVALGGDLGAAVDLERDTKQAPVLIQQVDIATAQPSEQPRRTLDVAEQEADGAGRKFRNGAQLHPNVEACQEQRPPSMPNRTGLSSPARRHPKCPFRMEAAALRLRRRAGAHGRPSARSRWAPAHRCSPTRRQAAAARYSGGEHRRTNPAQELWPRRE